MSQIQCLRSWQLFDLKEVEEHLLILGDTTANCARCKELGIDPWKAKECPACHTVFKYLMSRRLVSHPGERFQLAKRVRENRPDLQLLDYDDYQKTLGAQKARDFFSK